MGSEAAQGAGIASKTASPGLVAQLMISMNGCGGESASPPRKEARAVVVTSVAFCTRSGPSLCCWLPYRRCPVTRRFFVMTAGKVFLKKQGDIGTAQTLFLPKRIFLIGSSRSVRWQEDSSQFLQPLRSFVIRTLQSPRVRASRPPVFSPPLPGHSQDFRAGS